MVYVRPEHSKTFHVRLHYVAQEGAEWTGVLCFDLPGFVDLQPIFAEIRQTQHLPESSSVRVGTFALILCVSPLAPVL